MVDSYLAKARIESAKRFEKLRQELNAAEKLIAGKACVYTTGSFGRLEAGPHSDLDLFVVVDVMQEEGNTGRASKPLLDGIEETKLKYHLISAVEQCGIAKFDGGGRYLESHLVDDFVSALGSRSDDYQNTMTGRLLLLLESRYLLGEGMYLELINRVIEAYFVDFGDNKSAFIPSFLINDILRLWRTFCVNYEFSRKHGNNDSKIKNLKLKYSRMLTCYSAIIQLLSAHSNNGTVSPDDVARLVSLTPTERLEDIRSNPALSTSEQRNQFVDLINHILDDYSKFLQLTHLPKEELLGIYDKEAQEWKISSYKFGKRFAEALALLGNSRGSFDGLYRMILI